MTNPTDYSNNIDKLRLKLDYEKYDNESYKGYGETQTENTATGTQQAEPIVLPKLNYDKLIQDDFSIVDEEAEYVDDDDYQNEGGNKKVQKAIAKTAKISAKGSDNSGEFGSIGGKGSGFVDNAGGIANYGMQQIGMFQNVAETEAESWSGLANSVGGGAALGASVGGPWGAAIGGAVGGITGLIDMVGDIKKREEKAREKYDKTISFNTAKRKQDYTTKMGEESINKLAQLRKNQLGYINTEY